MSQLTRSTAATAIIRVFVYGTLKTNQPNHYWLTNPENGTAKLIGKGKTMGKFPLVIGTRYNIPFLLNKIGMGENIHGEIYEINETMLSKLDILEDYPTCYDRELQNIQLADTNEILPCWLYILRQFPATMLQKKFLNNYEDSAELPYCESLDDENYSIDLYENSEN